MSDIEINVLLSAKHISTGSWPAFKELALESEKSGYGTIWLADHLTRGGFRLECLSTLTAIAAITKKIRLGTLVLCYAWRNPALLAKITATIDVISEGRLEFGIGSCYLKQEFDAYGFPFPKFKDRIEQLSEAIEIIKKLWTEEKPSYQGKYYQIFETVCEPKPVQKPYPPITIGGGSESILSLVAKYADRWNRGYTVEEYKQKLKILDDCCSKYDRDFNEIKISHLFNIVGVYENEDETYEAWKNVWKREGRRFYGIQSKPVSFKEWYERMKDRNLMGTPEECAAKLEEYIEIGVKSFELRFVDLYGNKQILKRFMEKVVKRIL